MSLEVSMNTLAESNNALAQAMTRYAAVMESHLSANGSTPTIATKSDETAAPEKVAGKRRSKAEIAADAKAEVATLALVDAPKTEVDPFAEESEEMEETQLSADDIRALVLKVKAKSADLALGILKKIGVTTLAKIEEKDYPEVVRLAAKVGVEL